jgi:hypothetical protein
MPNPTPHGGHHSPNLSLATLCQNDPQGGAVVLAMENRDFNGARRSFFESHTGSKRFHSPLIQSSRDSNFVCLFDMEARVGQAVNQAAIVRQKDQSFALFVQAPDGFDTPRHFGRRQIYDAPLGVRIAYRAHVAARLVNREIHVFFNGLNAAAIYGHDIAFRIAERSQLRDALAVQRHAPFANQVLRMAARCNAARGQPFLDSALFHRALSLVQFKPLAQTFD